MLQQKYSEEKHLICRVLLTLFCSIMLFLSGVFPAGAHGENEKNHSSDFTGEWTPDSYEIHLLLNSDLVLDENHQLKKEFLDIFGTGKSYKTFSLAYFETQDRTFFEEGWINRIRIKYEEDEENDFKLTYKKRYPVPENGLISAVSLAESEGFDLSGNVWEPQVDWGYTGMTLSLSTNISIPADTEETIADLVPAEGLAMISEYMPAEEQNWKGDLWGIRTLESAELAGPIFYNRYKGEYLDRKVTIEVWEVHDERDDSIRFITELSFKADEFEEASAARKLMMDRLLDLGILLKVDSLKTRQMLDAYLVSPE